MAKIYGDERYIFTSAKTLRKAANGKPDVHGFEYHVIEELEDGYYVYISGEGIDPSQPSASYFIHKRYVLDK